MPIEMSMKPCCGEHQTVPNWYRSPDPQRTLRTHYASRSRSKRRVQRRNEYAEGLAHRRLKDYLITFSRLLTKQDRAVLRSAKVAADGPTTKDRFHKLADEWSSEVGNVSSVTALTSHRKYQEIIALGWDVVPYLLADLQDKRGFWFPALNVITGIRPFDPRDAGNVTRMTQAWVQWGKNKRII